MLNVMMQWSPPRPRDASCFQLKYITNQQYIVNCSDMRIQTASSSGNVDINYSKCHFSEPLLPFGGPGEAKTSNVVSPTCRDGMSSPTTHAHDFEETWVSMDMFMLGSRGGLGLPICGWLTQLTVPHD